MYRAGIVCVLSVAVILGAVQCTSSEPEQEPARESANLRTAVGEVTAQHCSSDFDLHLGDYTLFLREDYSASAPSIEGKLAAGGNVTLSGYRVGLRLPDTNISNTLVAGGNLTLTDGVVSGDTWYGGRYTPTRVGYPRGTVAQGTPINFAERFDQLRCLSSQLAAQPSNGTTRREPWGAVFMSGTDPCLNVFRMNASDFSGGQDWSISAPAGSFVVINIHGLSSTIRGGRIVLSGGITRQRVLYNFVDATYIDLGGFSVLGTMLAPEAHVTFTDEGWDGGLLAVSLTGKATGHLNPLDDHAGSRVDVCNGVDDNCNGQVDEGFECSGSGSRSCTAWCGAAGTQTCNPATCGYGECSSASCCRAHADCPSGSYCEGNTCTARLENGEACSSANPCASGQCVDGVCCDTACAGECDACNLAGHMGTCSLVAATVQCRASGGVCDVAEYCTGSAAACPADTRQPDTTECRSSVDACDVAEHCTGTGNDCPADGYASSTTECRTSGGECDVAEYCTGTGISCPADGSQVSGAACTSDSNACTVDVCDGTGNCSHPLLPAGTSCGSGQVCDATGQCLNGCWIEGAYHAAGTTHPDGVCQVCDPSQSTSTWSFKPATTECRTSEGVCDVAEYCTGSAAACPVDTQQPATTECRGAAGVCDVAEYCTGSAAACPADTQQSATTECRGPADVCDVAEFCTGSSNDCPADGYAPSTTECRGLRGECDVAEYCTGAGASCPADGFQASGAACTDDGNTCTVDVCNGTASCTHPLAPAGTSCGLEQVCNAAGQCQEPPGCWIAGAYYAEGTTNPSGVCQVCNPSLSTSSWSFKPSTTECRASGGTCDVAEYCTGSAAACPADARQPATTVCRGSTDTCDVAEYCTGTGTSCPADGFRPADEACTSDGNACTQDVCNGSGLCTHPPSPVGTSCQDGNACTTGDVCNGAGACGGTALSCTSPPNTECYQSAGTCSNGTCSYVPKSAGTPCNDSNACTTGDTCNGAGACTGTELSCSTASSYYCSGNERRKTTGTGSCSGGSCGSTDSLVETCATGSSSPYCSGNTVYQTVNNGCSGGSCMPSTQVTVQTCSPTTSNSCSGNQVQQTTTGFCSGGGCGGSSTTAVQTCSPTTSYSCSGNQVQQTTTGFCSGGGCGGSSTTTVQTCSPTTSYSCSGNQVQQTTTGFCSGGGCGGSSTTTVQTCSPTTSYSCSGNQVRQTTTGFCSGGGCGGSSTTTVQTCSPTTSYYCSGNDVWQSTTGLCNGSGCGGSTDSLVETCGNGLACSNGECVATDGIWYNAGPCDWSSCPQDPCTPTNPEAQYCPRVGASCHFVTGFMVYRFVCL